MQDPRNNRIRIIQNTNSNLSIVTHTVGNSIISQRILDGYIHATAMCKAAGKLFGHYMENSATKVFLEGLSSVIGIPITGKVGHNSRYGNNCLIQIIQGGTPSLQGTWVHPRVAIHLGQWLSPEFSIAVSGWVLDYHSGNLKQKIIHPYHLEMYFANAHKVPKDYFCICNFLYIELIGPLERLGLQISHKHMAYNSVGLYFNKHLKKGKNINSDKFPNYLHDFVDGRHFLVRMYPIMYGDFYLFEYFKGWYDAEWQRKIMIPYFKRTNQPEAIPYAKKLLQSLPEPPVLINGVYRYPQRGIITNY